jgi:hypothetical protein
LKIHSKYLLLSTALAAAGIYAASSFIANNQPFGYIGPATLSSTSFEAGDTLAYASWFDASDYKGNLIAYPMSINGVPQILAPVWNASGEIASQHHLTGRKIVTTDGAGTPSIFLWDSITDAQRTILGAEEVVNFIRGERANEGLGLTPRVRGSVLGDIIHSNPVYVQKPVSAFSDSDYFSFVNTHKDRAGMVYVGANDGMLHALNALTGTEVYAYIPSMVIPRLPKLALAPYPHTYFVDGVITVADVNYDDDWHSVLVGGLGAGGIGYFALDITTATAASETDATNKVLWEFHSGSTGATNLGYGFSRPSIAKTNSDKWAAIVGNGYLSPTGAASLYVLDASDGSVIRELVVPDANANGLSSPTLIDSDGDYKVDIAYAGDRNGNLWRFNLGDADPANWSVYANRPLFQTMGIDGSRQSITTAPEVGRHPVEGYMVYVATGELMDQFQASDIDLQAVYGIWDKDWTAEQLPVSIDTLLRQEYSAKTHPVTGASVRTATNYVIDWSNHKGWMMPLLVDNAIDLHRGERVIQNISLRDDRLEFVTINPSSSTGDNWYLQLNAFTGGAPTKTIVDANEDKILSLADNVDGNGDDLITDTAADRVIGTYLGFGLSSGPTVGGNTNDSSTSLFNHIEAISPTSLTFPDEPGLVGGHFDVDTSHGIYRSNLGADKTDGHVHEWDDTYDSATIDYFDMLPSATLFSINGGTNAVPDNQTPFFIIVANATLNSAGVMEINGSSFSVGSYFNLQQRWVRGELNDYEYFPTYILDPPTDAQKELGWQQLTSFKLSFDAFSILKGELLGTNTGCVRKNQTGLLGEYRNGALMVQALDAADFDGFTYDEANDVYIAANTVVDGTHLHARVHPDNEDGSMVYYGESMFWESTVFWHWDGDCYGQGDWQAQYDACLAQTSDSFCWVASDAEQEYAETTKTGDKDKETTTEPAPDAETDTQEVNPEHRLEAVTTADSSKEGRLYWRELIPD